MTEWLALVENSLVATWIRESSTLWAYPTMLTLHTVGLGIVVGVAALVDVRLLGLGRQIPVRSLSPFFRIIWWAFALNAATGVLLWMAAATTKSYQTIFHLKLALIAVAVVATFRLAKVVRHEPEPVDGVTWSAPVRRWALASLVLWALAIAAGRWMAYL